MNVVEYEHVRHLSEYWDLISPSGYVEEPRAVEPVDRRSSRRSEQYPPTDHEPEVWRTFIVSYERLDRETRTIDWRSGSWRGLPASPPESRSSNTSCWRR